MYDSVLTQYSIVWNLSQNVDRMNLAIKLGLAPCLTPTMIPFVTNRGGPITGLEALSLQGIPVDTILFTRETEDQLADLAGNAMSTTVVGSAIIAALVLGKDLIAKRNDVARKVLKKEADAMEVDEEIVSPAAVTSQIIGQSELAERTLDLSKTASVDLPVLLANAHRSRRLCQCEGRVNMTDKPLNECTACGTTTCESCGGRPEHEYVRIDLAANPRLAPGDFEKELREVLPMRLAVAGFTDAVKAAEGSIQAARQDDATFDARFNAWHQALLDVGASDLLYAGAKRQEVWTAVFKSATAQLELVLHHDKPEWVLYGRPKADVPANSIIRKVLAYPVARLRCGTTLFEGTWELALPRTTTLPLQLRGETLVDSWEHQIGLQLPQFKDTKVWSRLHVTIGSDRANALDRDVSGTYQLYDKCGTASSSLYKRVEGGTEGEPPLFFFLDPTRTDSNENDCFVFSRTHMRLQFGEARQIVARMALKFASRPVPGKEKPMLVPVPGWRPNSVEGSQDEECAVHCQWVPAAALSMQVCLEHFAFPET